MPDAPDHKIPCPTCGKRYRWVESMADRRVQCKQCSGYFKMPATAPGSAASAEEPVYQLTSDDEYREPAPPAAEALEAIELDEPAEPKPAAEPPPPPIAPAHVVEKTATGDGGSYELDLDDEAAPPAAPPPRVRPAAAASQAHEAKCPSCGSEVKPTAVLCINCGYNFKTKRKLEAPAPEPAEESAEPAVEEAVEELAEDDLVPAEAPPRPAAIAPNTLLLGGRSAVAKALDDGEMATDSRKTDLYAPLGLIGFGLIVLLLNAFVLGPKAEAIRMQNIASIFGGSGPVTVNILLVAIRTIVVFGVQLVIQIPLMLAGLFIVARMFGSSFGTIGVAILKLVAIAVVLGAINDSTNLGLDIITCGFGGLGWFISASVSFGLFWVLCSWLFEMEALEVLVMYFIMFFLPLLIMMFVGTIIFAMFA